MEEADGVYKVPCLVNGAKMKFVFDTGASVVSLSLPMAEYLLENDYITTNDLLEVGQSQTADGHIVDHLNINLKEIEIGGLKIYNVKAIVIASQNAPLLLGQSAIQQLGRIELEGANLIIYNSSDGLSDSEIDYYGNMADKAMSNRDYTEAAKKYQILYEANVLTEFGIYEFAKACMYSEDYVKAISLFKELLNSKYSLPSTYDPVSAQFNLFYDLASAYVSNNQSDWGNIYINHALHLADSVNYVGTKLYPSRIKEVIAFNYATTLWEHDKYSLAADYYFKAIEFNAQELHLTANTLINKCISSTPSSFIIENESLLDMVSNYVECLYYSNRFNTTETDKYMKALARNGSKYARIFCNTNGIVY